MSFILFKNKHTKIKRNAKENKNIQKRQKWYNKKTYTLNIQSAVFSEIPMHLLIISAKCCVQKMDNDYVTEGML